MKIHLFPDVSKLFLIARQSVEHGDSMEKGGQSLLEDLVDRVTGKHPYPAHENRKQRDQLLVLRIKIYTSNFTHLRKKEKKILGKERKMHEEEVYNSPTRQASNPTRCSTSPPTRPCAPRYL